MKSSFELLCHGHSLSETEAYQLFRLHLSYFLDENATIKEELEKIIDSTWPGIADKMI